MLNPIYCVEPKLPANAEEFKQYMQEIENSLYTPEGYNVVEVTYNVQDNRLVPINAKIISWYDNTQAIEELQQSRQTISFMSTHSENNVAETEIPIVPVITETQGTENLPSEILSQIPIQENSIVKYFKYVIPKEYASTNLLMNPWEIEVETPYYPLDRAHEIVVQDSKANLRKMNAATFQDHSFRTLERKITSVLYMTDDDKSEMLDNYYDDTNVEDITNALAQLYLQTNCTFYLHASVQLNFDYTNKHNPIELTQALYHELMQNAINKAHNIKI